MSSLNNFNTKDLYGKAPSAKGKRILLVEDDEDIVGLLKIHLEDLNSKLITCLNGTEGFEIASTQEFDLIILDIMLPGKVGTEICRDLRKAGNFTPIMMLSAKAEKYDKIIGLEYGADAYMTKPFRIMEFINQTNTLLSDGEFSNSIKETCNENHPPLIFGDLLIKPDCKEVFLNDEALQLSIKEFDLLFLFTSNPGKKYSRSELYKTIWGFDLKEYEYIVNSYINRLRNKIEPNIQSPTYLKTSPDRGYYFDA